MWMCNWHNLCFLLTSQSIFQPHQCDECSESFNKEHNLKLHKSLHQTLDLSLGNDKYRCPMCERSFSRLAGLKMHISLHAEEEVGALSMWQSSCSIANVEDCYSKVLSHFFHWLFCSSRFGP